MDRKLQILSLVFVLVLCVRPSLSQSENLTVIQPYEGYQPGYLGEVSYVIDNKQFIDSAPYRCLVSTEDPLEYEPTLMFIRATDEVSLNATVPKEQIIQAGYQPNKPTIIVVGGWQEIYPTEPWLRDGRNLVRQNGLIERENVFYWNNNIASNLSYPKAAAVSSGQGAYLANFVMKLYELGQDPSQVHLIGHSLGSHIVGFTGKRLRPEVGRITAIDPAGLCFGILLGNGPDDRLSPKDALVVRVLHYDSDFLGTPLRLGQIDVWVNGGATQPNTSQNYFLIIGTIIGSRTSISPDHKRSTAVATSQLTGTNCQEVAYLCSSYDSFQGGECGYCDDSNNQCYFMGLEFQYDQPIAIQSSANSSGDYYISTSGQAPYCLQHYQILINFQPNSNLLSLVQRRSWHIELQFSSDTSGQSSLVKITNQLNSTVFSYLHLSNSSQPAKVTSGNLRVIGFTGSSVDTTNYNITSVSVNFMSNIDPQVRRSLSSRLCVKEATGNYWLQLAECRQ